MNSSRDFPLEHAFFVSEDTIKMCAEKGVFFVPQCWGFSPAILQNPLVPKSKHEAIGALLKPAQANFGKWLLEHKAKVVFASDLVGEEGRDAINAPKKQGAPFTFKIGPRIELIALKPILNIIVFEGLRLGIEPG